MRHDNAHDGLIDSARSTGRFLTNENRTTQNHAPLWVVYDFLERFYNDLLSLVISFSRYWRSEMERATSYTSLQRHRIYLRYSHKNTILTLWKPSTNDKIFLVYSHYNFHSSHRIDGKWVPRRSQLWKLDMIGQKNSIATHPQKVQQLGPWSWQLRILQL